MDALASAPSGDLLALSTDSLSTCSTSAARNLTTKKTSFPIVGFAFSSRRWPWPSAPTTSPSTPCPPTPAPSPKFNTTGYFLGFVGAGAMVYPQNLCTDAAGNIYAADSGLERGRQAVAQRHLPGHLQGPHPGPFEWFVSAPGLAVDPTNGHVVVTDAFNRRLVVFYTNATVYQRVSTAFNGVSSSPQAVVVTSYGHHHLHRSRQFLNEIDRHRRAHPPVGQPSLDGYGDLQPWPCRPTAACSAAPSFLSAIYVYDPYGALLQTLVGVEADLEFWALWPIRP